MRIEVWKSSQNQEERHIFESDGANSYVCGFNPAKIQSRDIIKLLESSGYVIPTSQLREFWELTPTTPPPQSSIRIKSRNTR